MQTKPNWVPDVNLLKKYEDNLLPLTAAISHTLALNPQSQPTILDTLWSLLKNSTISIARKIAAWVEICQLYGCSVTLQEVLDSAPLDENGEIHCKASRAIVTLELQNHSV